MESIGPLFVISTFQFAETYCNSYKYQNQSSDETICQNCFTLLIEWKHNASQAPVYTSAHYQYQQNLFMTSCRFNIQLLPSVLSVRLSMQWSIKLEIKTFSMQQILAMALIPMTAAHMAGFFFKHHYRIFVTRFYLFVFSPEELEQYSLTSLHSRFDMHPNKRDSNGHFHHIVQVHVMRSFL